MSLTEMTDTSYLEISLNRIDHNLQVMRKLVQRPDRFVDTQPKICAVIKSDAYGLGAVPIAKRLISRGVDMLAVYSIKQAEQLIQNAVTCPILLLSPLREMTRSILE